MNLLLILSFFFQLEILSKKCRNETAAMDSVVDVNNASTGRYARATNPIEFHNVDPAGTPYAHGSM